MTSPSAIARFAATIRSTMTRSPDSSFSNVHASDDVALLNSRWHIGACDDASEDRVFAVEIWTIGQSDVDLAVGFAGIAGVGHGHCAFGVQPLPVHFSNANRRAA